MSGFESLSKPLKPRSEVVVHTVHPTLEQKPRAKYSVPDWFNHKYEFSIYPSHIQIVFLFSYAISYDAERSRNVSHQVRQDGRRLINETYNESWWNKHDK
jgi:tektin-2